MKALRIMFKRDLANTFNKKFFLLLVFMVLLQIWFITGSDSVDQVLQSGKMEFMAIVFSFNLLGSIVALALNYNGMSSERETKILDMVLTSGISKKKVFLSKALSGLAASGVFAVLYVLAILLAYLILLKDPAISFLSLRYIIPVAAFLSIYCLMGLLLSIVFRSSKASLVVSMILGGLLIPRIFLMFTEGIAKLLGLEGNAAEMMGMISPALIMNALSGYEEPAFIITGVILLFVYLAGMIIAGIAVFARQDELNYGE